MKASQSLKRMKWLAVFFAFGWLPAILLRLRSKEETPMNAFMKALPDASRTLVSLFIFALTGMTGSVWAQGPEFCWKDSYGRGVGTVPNSCARGQERIGLLCYDRCPSGMVRFGLDCHSVCPSGMQDQGLFCLHDRSLRVFRRG